MPGLVIQDKQGREVFNKVDYAAMKQVLTFLTSECCTGITLETEAAA